MVRQWQAAGFWLRDQDRVTSATWFTSKDTQRDVRRAGVLVLSSIGHEEATISIGAPEIAGAIAARGLLSLSIEFAGSGQSPDEVAQPDIVKIWCRQIVAGIALLRKNGAERIAIVAPRLAATLALVALAETPVDAIVLWSPALSGRRYVRELRMMQGTSGGETDQDGGVTIAGFTLPKVVLDAVARLEPSRVAPAPAVLYLEAPDRNVDATWVSRWRALGSYVDERTSPDTTPWLFTPSDNCIVPFESARQVAAWLDERLAVRTKAAPVDLKALPTSMSFSVGGREVRETFVSIGELGLSGVLVEPVEPEAPTTKGASVLYLSTIGPGRSYVLASRKAASEGRLGLRFDFAGFGLSPLRPSQTEAELYGASGGDDVRLGVDFLLSRGAPSVVVVGFCAGAWSSIVTEPMRGVVGIAAINVHLSVRLRTVSERSKNNFLWQLELGRPGASTILGRVRDRLDRLKSSAGPAVGWLTALGNAGVLVGLFFDQHDLGLQYWENVLSEHFRRQVGQRKIEVRAYTGLGHLVEGQQARATAFEDIRRFVERADALTARS